MNSNIDALSFPNQRVLTQVLIVYSQILGCEHFRLDRLKKLQDDSSYDTCLTSHWIKYINYFHVDYC